MEINFNSYNRLDSLFIWESSFLGVPGMAWIQLEINQPQVVTVKRRKPQPVDSNDMGEGSNVM